MLAVAVGLIGALVFGAADFVGGLAARRISALRVTAVGGLSGVVLIAVLLPLVGGTWSVEAVLLGALAGLAGAVAIALLYGCLALGTIILAAIILKERVTTTQYLGLALAIVAAAMLSLA